MSQILENLRNVDPNNSDAVKEIITAFYQNLPKHTEVNCNIWLHVLESVITRFPRYCAQHRTTIENYLLHFLDSPNYYNVIEAAKCAHGLQQIRPSQDKAATAKNCWREQMNILCNTAHKLIDALFAKTVDIYKNNKNAKKLDTSLLTNAPLTTALQQILNVKKGQASSSLEKNLVLCNKLRNIFVFIQAMLVEVYPVAKPVQPQIILEVVIQALSVSSNVNTDVTEAATVKIQGLRTLDAMISCLGPNLLPFSALVFRCIMQTLRWSSDNPSDESSKVRIAAYNSLNKWLSTLHVHRVGGDDKARSWEDELTKHIVTDITPPRKVVQLTMSNQYTKNLSKKARKRLANTTLQQSTLASHMPGEKNKATVSEESNDEVANAALECAETFLTVCGIFLKPTTHKIFHERLVRECYNIAAHSPARGARLLRALDAGRKNCASNVPPPTHYLLQLYSTLINSDADEIKKFCSQAILDIRLQLHCSPPTLTFALDAQPEKNSMESRKRTSERNRAALEALLGKDRMPPRKDDVYTISDEPSSKIPRQDTPDITEIPDNLSISSGSNTDVEIVDEYEADVEILADKQTEEQENVEEPQEKQVSEDEDTNVIEVEDEQNVTDVTADVTDVTDSATVPSTSQDEVTTNIQNKHVEDVIDIHEAATQAPSPATADSDKSDVSMEVVYDPDAQTTVTALEKMDDENLPSTNDTDDVQITCGQKIQSSQDVDSTVTPVEEPLKLNGVNNEVEEKSDENVDKIEIVENIEVKITTKEITVEDMLADFVDEVNEEAKITEA
ncbi:proline-, glutamic acid- and leucine-rich protein 1-like [Anticarsia gemmatalis]|uniref:proline-, glutamic acid- and leucine-rich protein 1-like n=1 Tax=Anticarsia gemmatalis TaxID=129554 RepID=UPI003F778313